VPTLEPTNTNSLRIAVVGAHLGGQPLNHQLTDRAARLVSSTQTASCYRLYALATTPPKPGLVRVSATDTHASAIDVEVWEDARCRRSDLLVAAYLRADSTTGPGHRSHDVPFGRSRGPSIKRDPRYLDLRDNLADLLIA
jgi:hypothetical protein